MHELLRYNARSVLPEAALSLMASHEGNRERFFAVVRTRSYNEEKFETEVPDEAAKALLAELDRIRMRIVPKEVWGIDGHTHSLTIVRGFNESRFQWWCELPRQWKALAPIVRRLIDLAGPRAAEVFDEVDRAGP